jgi:hypothetical protein
MKFLSMACLLVSFPSMPVVAESASSTLTSATLEETIHKEKYAVATESLELRGKQLRMAIEQDYQRLEESKTINSKTGSDITAAVVRYIPMGTSFDDAEQILRSAGFDVGSRFGPKSPAIGFRLPNQRYVLTARINSLHGSLFSLRTVSVIVFLAPDNPDIYEKVVGVSASILLSYP